MFYLNNCKIEVYEFLNNKINFLLFMIFKFLYARKRKSYSFDQYFQK